MFNISYFINNYLIFGPNCFGYIFVEATKEVKNGFLFFVRFFVNITQKQKHIIH